jgi:hypothetical protein
MDRIYFDYHSVWNASFSLLPDSLTMREYRSISVRRGILDNRVSYSDWATAWTQHWWTGGPNDRPLADPALPRVEIESNLPGPSGVLYHLLAHEVGHALDYDNRRGLRRAETKAFEPEEFGYLSWISPSYVDTANVAHRAVAREPAFEQVRTIDFDGAVTAGLAMLDSAEKAGRVFDAGAVAVRNWQPASRDGIATFLDRLDHSSFTTVFSTWRPEDDWTESFAAMMLPSIARRFDIIGPGGARVRVLNKVLGDTSPFAPKRRFIQQIIDRALADFRARQAASPDACFQAALATRR